MTKYAFWFAALAVGCSSSTAGSPTRTAAKPPSEAEVQRAEDPGAEQPSRGCGAPAEQLGEHEVASLTVTGGFAAVSERHVIHEDGTVTHTNLRTKSVITDTELPDGPARVDTLQQALKESKVWQLVSDCYGGGDTNQPDAQVEKVQIKRDGITRGWAVVNRQGPEPLIEVIELLQAYIRRAHEPTL